MSKAAFQIYFCGPALESGQMDVKELAPALLGIGSLIEESNRVINGNKSTVSIKVVNFKDGSFGISLELVQTICTQFINAFSSEKATAAANILTFLGVGGVGSISIYGLIKLLKNLKNRKLDDVKKLQDGNIEIIIKEQNIIITPEVFSLYQDIKVRKEMESIVKPLIKEGIDSINFKYNKEIVESIDKKELPYFEMPEIEDKEIDEDVFVATYSIQSLSFKEDNKWKLSDGTNVFYVTISDKNYLDKIDKNLVSFSKGDRLKVKLKIKNYETLSGLKTDYEVLEIINHAKPPSQLPLILKTRPKKEEDSN